MLSYFGPVREREICELIVRSPTKSCMLDPITISLLKLCLNDLVPLVTTVINVSISTGNCFIGVSISTGIVPKQFEQYVVPLLKKTGLDRNDFKTFWTSVESAIYFKGS